MIYLFFFLTVAIILLIVESYKNKKVINVTVFLCILILSFLAGVRDTSIGTDVAVYLVPMWTGASGANSISEYMEYNWVWNWSTWFVSQYEIAFTMLVFCITKIFGDIHFVLFFVQLFTLIPLSIALKNLKDIFGKKINYIYTIGFLIYMFLFFNVSLNLMRQWIAIPFSFLALTYIFKRKYFKALILWLVAFLFHTSAIVFLVVIIMYLLIVRFKSNSKIVNFLKFAFLGVISIFSYIIIIRYPELLDMYGLHYSAYISGDFKFLPNQIIIRFPIIFMILFCFPRNKNRKNRFYFYLLIMLFDLLLSQLASVNDNAGRVCFFFSINYLIIFLDCYLVCKEKYSKHISSILVVLLLCYLVIYWVYFYAIGNSSQTFPYKFYFLENNYICLAY